jgi:hypothetical protein
MGFCENFIRIGLAVVAASTMGSCKPANGGGDDEGSSVASAAFVIPSDVQKGLGGATTGRAELRTYEGASGVVGRPTRVFAATLEFRAGVQGSTLTFSQDTAGNSMVQGEQLRGIYLFIMTNAGTEVYKGAATPGSVTLAAGANPVSVALTCTAAAACGQENYQVNGIAGNRSQVQQQAVSLKVNVTVNNSGSEASGRQALQSCVQQVKQAGCNNLERTACNAVFSVDPNRIASMQYSGVVSNSGTVKGYLAYCEQLGIVRKT